MISNPGFKLTSHISQKDVFYIVQLQILHLLIFQCNVLLMCSHSVITEPAVRTDLFYLLYHLIYLIFLFFYFLENYD